MRVLTDFHHQSLLQSLIMLFEGRLGGELYRPIGMEWFTEGYWKINDQEDTAKQFLELNSVPSDGTPPLNDSEITLAALTLDGVRSCHLVNDVNGTNKAVTLKEFKRAKFDILIASIPEHIEPFLEMIRLYQPQAKLIYQVGNNWTMDAVKAKNIMASARLIGPMPTHNVVEYHQEFDLNIFDFTPVPNDKKVYSFINVLQEKPQDWELFLELERLMPDWEFKSFGGQCRDGNMTGPEELAAKMKEATFIFQCKTGGDGYGHIIHNAAAIGRPLITRLADYKGKMAESLIEDGVTSITIDSRELANIVDILELIGSRPSTDLDLMSKMIHGAFKRNVDFDKEEQEIRKFLERLQ